MSLWETQRLLSAKIVTVCRELGRTPESLCSEFDENGCGRLFPWGLLDQAFPPACLSTDMRRTAYLCHNLFVNAYNKSRTVDKEVSLHDVAAALLFDQVSPNDPAMQPILSLLIRKRKAAVPVNDVPVRRHLVSDCRTATELNSAMSRLNDLRILQLPFQYAVSTSGGEGSTALAVLSHDVTGGVRNPLFVSPLKEFLRDNTKWHPAERELESVIFQAFWVVAKLSFAGFAFDRLPLAEILVVDDFLNQPAQGPPRTNEYAFGEAHPGLRWVPAFSGDGASTPASAFRIPVRFLVHFPMVGQGTFSKSPEERNKLTQELAVHLLKDLSEVVLEARLVLAARIAKLELDKTRHKYSRSGLDLQGLLEEILDLEVRERVLDAVIKDLILVVCPDFASLVPTILVPTDAPDCLQLEGLGKPAGTFRFQDIPLAPLFIPFRIR